MELDELKKELQSYKDSRDKAIKAGEDFMWINEIIHDLEQDIERLSISEPDEEPAAVVIRPAFKLPTNYNLIFGDTRANEEITNLIIQVESQLNKDHEEALEAIFETHRLKVAELQGIIDIGVPENERLAQLVEDLEAQAITLGAAKVEAEAKRNNAVAIKEEAEAVVRRVEQEKVSLLEQIKELEGMLQVYRKKPDVLSGITLTTTLKAETEEEKAARIEKARVDQINKNLTKYDNIAPLPTKDEIVTSKQLDESFRSVAADPAVASDESGGNRVSEAAAPVEQAEDGTSKLAIEQQLYIDVAVLKQQMFNVMQHLSI